jgi:hypothetical protein
MSTKTTFKRVALVAVAALGLGVLTSVAPANAAASDVTAIAAGTSSPARVAVWGGATTITLSSDTTATDAVTLTAQITASPATSSTAGLDFVAKAAGTGNITTISSETVTATTAAVASATFNMLAAAKENITLKLKADVAGTYQVLVTVDGNTTTGYSAGKKSVAYSITTAGTPTAMTITKLSGAIVGGAADDFGLNLAISLKDANGNATVLGANEGLAVSQTAAVAAVTLNNAATAAFDSSSSTTDGAYILLAEGKTIAAAATNIITIKGDGILPATLVQNYSATMTAAVAAVAGTFSLVADSDATAVATGTGYTGATVTWKTAALSSHYFKYAPTTQAAAATNYAVNVTDTAGVKYATSVAVPALGTTAVPTLTYGIATISSAITVDDDAALTVAVDAAATTPSYTIGYDLPVASKVAVVSPSSAIISATGATNTFVAKVTDQYGDAMAGKSVSVVVTGRNGFTTAKQLGITDATGLVTYTLTDAGTTGTTDSVVFTSTVSSTAYVLTYGTYTVAKVSFTGPNTTAGVATATTTVSPIEADNTPESATVDAVATVTDANGSLLVGVPVVFTVSGTGAAFTTTTATAYTASNGKATAKLYAWLAGSYTVTATAGTVTGTGSYTFANSRAADARTVSAVVNGGVVTAKVVDRFGNPVKGATVYATKSGTGYFGTGVSKTKDTTGVDGTVDFIVNGSADVTVSTLDYDAAVGANPADQTCALAGNSTCASGATAAVAFTATTAGTSLVNAKNVGSSYAPAGVNKVSVAVSNDAAQAAADASAEATDAANAATDAANAAAEAADAATAAAQDAADAVAALSTQVSEMVDALKKQITALTNLVIKIQKKVKA